MNLKKIINEMQKLNSEQEYIKDKYSINGKKINVFRGDIK